MLLLLDQLRANGGDLIVRVRVFFDLGELQFGTVPAQRDFRFVATSICGSSVVYINPAGRANLVSQILGIGSYRHDLAALLSALYSKSPWLLSRILL